MLHNVFLKSLRDQRRALFWWAVGLIGLALYIIMFYPTIRDSAGQVKAYFDTLPEALKTAFFGQIQEFGSPDSFLNSYLFFFFAPLLFLIYAVVFGRGRGARHSGVADPLANGLDLGHVAVLIGVTVLLLAAALVSFERRDLAV